MRLLFSQRYRRAIQQKLLHVDLPDEARRQVWNWLTANDISFRVQRDPGNSFASVSSILGETERDLCIDHGWERLPRGAYSTGAQSHPGLRQLFLGSAGHLVFDAVEIASLHLQTPERDTFRQRVNKILEMHECPWRLADGEFFKLDADFVGARVATTAHETLTANRFAGAAHEYAKARQYLASGDVREAIFFAGHSLESVMKVLSGLEQANADHLIKELGTQGFFDDLPELVRPGFMDQVLKALPFLRNKLGGHGQGKDVVPIPPAYGDLAIQIAAAFQNFLIAKYLQRSAAPVETTDNLTQHQPEDEPPF